MTKKGQNRGVQLGQKSTAKKKASKASKIRVDILYKSRFDDGRSLFGPN